MIPDEQTRFFAGAAKHGTLAEAFWEVASDLDAMRGNHEAYVKAAFDRAVAAAVAEEREACASMIERMANEPRSTFVVGSLKQAGRDIAAAIRVRARGQP